MRIIIFGEDTEFKKMFVLAMARIISGEHTVRVYTAGHYPYEEMPADDYDFCGVEFRRFKDSSSLPELLGAESCEYALLDICRDADAGTDVKIIAVCEPGRRLYERFLENAGLLLKRYPYTDVHLVFANILDGCKVNRAFMERLYERAMKDSTNITKVYEIYFDERNAVALYEGMYEERLLMRRYTPEFRMQLANILGEVLGYPLKRMKKIMRKAERKKRKCR
jgi:hypothetical protein